MLGGSGDVSLPPDWLERCCCVPARWVLRNLIRASMRPFAGAPTSPGRILVVYSSRLSGFCRNHTGGARVLSISGRRTSADLGLGGLEIVEANYPEYNILESPAFPENTFDYVVSDRFSSTWEGNSQRRCFDECHLVPSQMGFAVDATCFVHPIHYAPKDLWRFSPQGLQFLAGQFSKVLECGGWGNAYVWLYIWLGLRNVPRAARQVASHPQARYEEQRVLADRHLDCRAEVVGAEERDPIHGEIGCGNRAGCAVARGEPGARQ